MFPIIPANSVTAVSGNQEGIFGFGHKGGAGNYVALTNIVSSAGVVADDQAATTGTARTSLAGCEYGEDTGIFGFGYEPVGGYAGMTNLVSNTGVVASDTAAVGTVRGTLAACEYGEDKGIFAYGSVGSAPWMYLSMSNKVSNAGVVASDTTGVGTARYGLAACEYGEDTGIMAFGYVYGVGGSAISNLISNAGVVATDTAAVVGATARYGMAGCSYGGDKGIIGYGIDASGNVSMTNKVSNGGVVASDTTGVGTARRVLAACEYGGDKGIFGFGYDATGNLSMTNKVSNGGVVADDTTGVGTARSEFAACSFN